MQNTSASVKNRETVQNVYVSGCRHQRPGPGGFGLFGHVRDQLMINMLDDPAGLNSTGLVFLSIIAPKYRRQSSFVRNLVLFGMYRERVEEVFTRKGAILKIYEFRELKVDYTGYHERTR